MKTISYIFAAFAAALFATLVVASGHTFEVEVGPAGKLEFIPNFVQANPGDRIRFVL